MGFEVLVNPLQESTPVLFFLHAASRRRGGHVHGEPYPGQYIGMKILAPVMQPVAMGCGPAGGLSCIRDFYLENVPSHFPARER
jgi:phosphomannomutase